jgi:CheY-like chemotaxis protein
MSFNQPVICPVYQNNEKSNCMNEHPCSDVVITDQRMPFMSGIQILRDQAKNGCRLTPMNKAIITSYLDESEQKALQELGAFYLAKPFRMMDLSPWLDECEKRLDISTPVGVRRREKRIPAHREITCCIEALNKIMTGIVTDYSPSGFCVQTTFDFDGAKQSRSFHLFLTAARRCRCAGRKGPGTANISPGSAVTEQPCSFPAPAAMIEAA